MENMKRKRQKESQHWVHEKARKSTREKAKSEK